MLGSLDKPVHVPSEAANWAVADGWHRLDDLCEGVFDCPHTTPTLASHGPYVVRSQDIRTGVFRLSGAGQVSEETYKDRIARAEPRYGDLFYSREGTYFGIAAEVPPRTRVCLGQRMVLIRPDAKKLDYRFLKYWLNSSLMARHIAGFRDGTVAERLNMPVIRALPIPALEIGVQGAIGCILGALDDKIELNRRMNETLEAMARAIFKDWFVDFGPTRAKMEGRAPNLAPDIWSVFPDRLDDDGKPDGWTQGSVSNVASIMKETVNPQSLPDVIFSHYSIPAYDSGQKPGLDRGADIKSNKTVVPTNSVLLSKLNPEIVRVWLTDVRADEKAICSTELLAMQPKAPVDRAFLFCLFHDSAFRDDLRAMMTGTSNSHQRVKPQSILDVQIVIPNEETIERFNLISKPFVDRMLVNRREVQDLATLRDLLLPKLMSSEIRVKDAEKIVGEAT